MGNPRFYKCTVHMDCDLKNRNAPYIFRIILLEASRYSCLFQLLLYSHKYYWDRCLFVDGMTKNCIEKIFRKFGTTISEELVLEFIAYPIILFVLIRF